MRPKRTFLITWTAAAAMVVLVLGASRCSPSGPRTARRAGASDTAIAAEKTYVAPGDLDQYYMFSSGGHSGQVYVYGLPSMRHIATVPVFAPYPATGYGFDDDTKAMLGARRCARRGRRNIRRVWQKRGVWFSARQASRIKQRGDPVRVSVVIPAYNGEAFLGRAIESVQAQRFAEWMLIVVDDGSADGTVGVAHEYAAGDRQVRVVEQANAGVGAARNRGLAEAEAGAEFVIFLDQDDVWEPDALAVLVEALERQPEAVAASGLARIIDREGRAVYPGELEARGRHRRGVVGRHLVMWPREQPTTLAVLAFENCIYSPGQALIRRSALEAVGPFDAALAPADDWDMWLRLALAGCPMQSVRRPVSLYRFHRMQMTRIGRQMTTATFAVLEKTFAIPDLPEAWRARRDEAYSRAYLRAAAQAYTAQEYPFAMECMSEAVRLDPRLCSDGGTPVARIAAVWANHVKTREPMGFLRSVYDHLPPELAALRERRRRAPGGRREGRPRRRPRRGRRCARRRRRAVLVPSSRGRRRSTPRRRPARPPPPTRRARHRCFSRRWTVPSRPFLLRHSSFGRQPR